MEEEKVFDQLFALHAILCDHFLCAIPRRTEHSLTRNEVKILFILCRMKQSTAKNLIMVSGIKQPNIVPVIHSLEAKGLIERATNKSDQREKIISITERGLEEYATCVSEVKQYFQDATTDELETIQYMLRSCLDAFEK